MKKNKLYKYIYKCGLCGERYGSDYKEGPKRCPFCTLYGISNSKKDKKTRGSIYNHLLREGKINEEENIDKKDKQDY